MEGGSVKFYFPVFSEDSSYHREDSEIFTVFLIITVSFSSVQILRAMGDLTKN